MSETTDTTAHEAYAFACMRCGSGWEQAYEIEHHVDVSGRPFVVYKCDGKRVPSPLSSPTCANCGGHVVRIMRAGQVSTVRRMLHTYVDPATGSTPSGRRTTGPAPHASAFAAATAPVVDRAEPTTGRDTAPAAPDAGATPAGEPHHWHLADLLHPFQRR